MEKKTREYLTIAMAMLTILLCGYGIGYLVGEKKGLRSYEGPRIVAGLGGDWAKTTMIRLDKKLILSPGQQEKVHRKVLAASGELQLEIEELRQSQNRILLKLYAELDRDLEPSQRAELEKLRRELPMGE